MARTYGHEANTRVAAGGSKRERLWAAWDEARFAFRTIRGAPGLSATIIASLAIVIGANTAVFGLLDGLFLRRLAVPRAEELVGLRPASAGLIPVTYQRYMALRSALPEDRIEAMRFDPVSIQTRSSREDVWMDFVSGGFFGTVGVRPLLGRFLVLDDEARALPVVVVGEEFWRRSLGADSGVIGQTVSIEGDPYVVVGVMPASYHGVHFARAFTLAAPITVSPDYPNGNRLAREVALIARRPPNVNRSVFEQRLDAVFTHCCVVPGRSRFAALPMPDTTSRIIPTVEDGPAGVLFPFVRPSAAKPHVFLEDASRGLQWNVDYRSQFRIVLVSVQVGVLVLLLIACANVATLLLARAESREREFAVRIALGSGRGRLALRLLVEALELAAVGTVIGLMLGRFGAQFLAHEIRASATHLTTALSWHTSPTVIAFTIGVACLCTVLAGVWPARRAARTGLLSGLSGATRLVGSNRAWTIERVLVTSQIALAVVLIVGAALFERTLRNLTAGIGGYHATNLVLVGVGDPSYRFGVERSSSSVWSHWQDITAAAQRVPGVSGATIALSAPVFRYSTSTTTLRVPHDLVQEDYVEPERNSVAPGFFAVSGIGIVRGREFTANDLVGDRSAIIVSESFARRHLGIERAIGTELMYWRRPQSSSVDPSTRFVVVGVAGDARYDRMTTRGTAANLRDVRPEQVYFPLSTRSAGAFGSVIVRTAGDAQAVVAPLRHAMEATGFVRVNRVTTVAAAIDAASVRERFAASLGMLFGLIALTLAAMGVFAVLAYSVARRTREIGVRLAIGAQPRDAQLLIVRHAARTAVIGVAVGAPVAIASAWTIRGELYGVSAADPLASAGAVAVLLLVALAASVIPARRAARIDPVEALRAE